MRLKLRARKRAGVLAMAVVAGATVLGAAGGGGAAGAATLPGGTWGQPQAIAGLAAPNGAQETSFGSAVSCASLGNCTAVGSYYSATGIHPFAVTETDGTWGSTQSLAGAPGAPSSAGALEKVSCGAPGYCTASGSYRVNGSGFAYLATEVKGTWSVRPLPGTIGPDTVQDSSITAVACTGAGDCTAVGDYTATSNGSSVTRAFTLDESGGTWGTPQPVTGLPPGGSSPGPTSSGLASVSCSGPGECTAGGYYDAGSGHMPFLVSESGGTWGSAQAVPGFAKLTSSSDITGAVNSVSCPDATDCAVAGAYRAGSSGTSSAVFTADEVAGTWESAKTLNAPSQALAFGFVTVGCRAAGNCVVTALTVLNTVSSGTQFEVSAATETSGGAWGQAQALPGIPAGDESIYSKLSCVANGDCTVAGSYYPPSGFPQPHQAFAATITADGAVGTVQPVQPTTTLQLKVEGLDCPQDGYCTLLENDGNFATLVTEANPASLTLTASAPQVSYGTAATFTATVSSAAGGTPTGTVAVTGPSGAACTITLSGGTGTCSFSPAQFSPGTYTVTGAYSGDPHYLAASATASVTVAKARTATRLTLSSLVITLGQGTAETLTATVSHAGSTAPPGTVTVKDGSYAVCTITLAKGAGSCAVNAGQLITHGRVLTAAYPGDKNFLPSTSPPSYLTLAPARPRLARPLTGRPAAPVSRWQGRPALPAG